MTDYELNFSIKIEEMLSIVDEPVFRQIIVEVGINSFWINWSNCFKSLFQDVCYHLQNPMPESGASVYKSDRIRQGDNTFKCCNLIKAFKADLIFVLKFVNQAIEMYCIDKKCPDASYSYRSNYDSCQYNKANRLEFFNEKHTTAYLSRACIESLLKCSAYTLDSFDSTCKINWTNPQRKIRNLIF